MIKNRWSDGSAKFAIIAGRANLVSGTPLTVRLSGSAPPAAASPLRLSDLKGTGITAEVAASGRGSAAWAGPDWDTPLATWLSGSEMSSWVYRKPIGADAHLVAWLEVRLFAGGAVEVLPWVENGYLRVAAPGARSSTYSFSLGGTQRFNATIDLQHHQRTPLLRGTALSYWLGNDPEVLAKHDAAYLQSSELVPTYRSEVAEGSSVVAGLVSSYTPLQQGNFDYSADNMASAGYQSCIGLLPQHDVLYLTSGSAAGFAAVVRNGYSAGRYALHYRDETTQRPPAFSTYPTLVLAQSGSGLKDTGASTTSSYTPNTTGGTGPGWDTAHAPSVGFMAYLLTGRFYFMEETQFCATTSHFNVTDWSRAGGSRGVPAPGYTGASGICSTFVQTRSGAWWFRALAQALCVTPDDHPLQPEFAAAVQNTINWHHARYVEQANNPYGWVEPGEAYSGPAGSTFGSPWQQDFITAAWGYGLSMGLPIDSTAATRFQALFAWKAKSIVGRLGSSSSPDWWYINATPYTVAMAPSATPDFARGTGPWYPSWRAAYDATLARYGVQPWIGSAEGVLASEVMPGATAYWGNLQPAIAYAVRHSVPGAAAAYQRMTSASNWGALAAEFNARPVWAVTASSGPLLAAGAVPLWTADKAVHQWFAIRATAFSPNGAHNARTAFSNIAVAGTQILLAASGGHNDSASNAVVGIELAADEPRWVNRRDSTWNGVEANVPYYSDGSPASRHIYWSAHYSTTRGRLMLHGSRAVYGSALSFAASNGLDLGTNRWDAAGTWRSGYSALCRDSSDNCWAGSEYYRLRKWTASTDTWIETGRFSGEITAPMQHDSSRDLLFQLSWGDGQNSGSGVRAFKYTIGGTVQTPITLNSLGGALRQFERDTPSYASMVYDPDGDRFLFWDGVSGRLYQVNPNAGNIWDICVVDTSGVRPPPRGGQFGRMAYVAALQCIVVMPWGNHNLYAMRLT